MSAPLELSTDVLVIGGGPAATWAALHARESRRGRGPGRQGLLRDQWRDGAIGHRGLVRGARSGEAKRGQGEPGNTRWPSRRPPLDGSGSRADVHEHGTPRYRRALPVPDRPGHRCAGPYGRAGPRVHAPDAGVDPAGRRTDPRPFTRPRTARRDRRICPRRCRIPAARESGLHDPRRRGGARQRRVRVPVPGAWHQRQHR